MADARRGWGGHSPDGTRVGISARAQSSVAHKFLWGNAHPTSVLRKAVVTAACTLVAVAAIGGCGEEGVAEDATVAAYVEAPLCVAAKQELASHGGHAEDLKVRAVCLPSGRDGERLSLATLGANARQATEDSTTVGYLEAPDPAAARFTHPILESAGIAWISRSSGKTAMADLLQAIESAGSSGSLRESVRNALHV